MKKALMILGLLLVVSAIFAQSSLYDMQFNDSITATISRLKAKGFVESYHSDSFYTFGGGTNADLPSIDIYLSSDNTQVLSWKLKYDLKANPDLADFVTASLVALHGEPSVIADYDYDLIWYFTNEKALYVDIFEGNSMVLDYTYGNWDDDDYYYYYEEY